jgi:predicted nucleic acid-binding protein
LDYGAKVSQKSEENLKKLYRLVDVVQVIPFDIEWAKIFGTIKSKLRSLGKPTLPAFLIGDRNNPIDLSAELFAKHRRAI